MSGRDRPDDSAELGDLLEPLRRYHEPGVTPREEMWTSIVAQIRSEAAAPTAGTDALAAIPTGDASAGPTDRPAAEPPVHSIEQHARDAHPRRRLARPMPWLGWAAAASVVLLVGIALGRSTVPQVPAPAETPVAAAPDAADAGGSAPATGLDVAVRRHLGRSESLLTTVRSDGRQGRLDPSAAAWARGLLTQTRLLLDARAGGDPAIVALLEDLELVLAEIVVVAGSGSPDGAREQAELDLMLRALELGSLLPRLQSECPRGCAAPAA